MTLLDPSAVGVREVTDLVHIACAEILRQIPYCGDKSELMVLKVTLTLFISAVVVLQVNGHYLYFLY